MGFFAQIVRRLSGAFAERNLIGTELRELIDRDLAVLVHKRNKFGEGDMLVHDRWFADLEAFVTRSLRPKLAGRSVIALWSDRALDAMVRDEQALPATVPAAIPVTSRCGSHWAQ
jgi:hypothetical protein